MMRSAALASLLALLSCSSTPTRPASASSHTADAALTAAKQPDQQQQDDGVIPPEIVRVEAVRIENRVKILTVGNVQGHYLTWCNADVDSCITPIPGKDYLLFTKATRWRFPGAKDFMTLKWIQDWSITYNNQENIALVPRDGGGPNVLGMYVLRSWEKSK
jgi:hypothetical protein